MLFRTLTLVLLTVSALSFETGDCKTHKDETSCAGDHGCVWCQAWAIPSACFTEADAKALSDSVFECHWPSALELVLLSA